MVKNFIRWCVARGWKNFGQAYETVYRSGQMGPLRLILTNWILKFDLVIALNQDESSYKERFEKQYFEKRIKDRYIHFNFGAGGNMYPTECDQVLSLLETSAKEQNQWCVLLHCAGGKDRTGGVLGMWFMRTERVLISEWDGQNALHGVPAEGWWRAVLREYLYC